MIVTIRKPATDCRIIRRQRLPGATRRTFREPQVRIADAERDGAIHLISIHGGADFILLFPILYRHAEKGAFHRPRHLQLASLTFSDSTHESAFLLHGPLLTCDAARHANRNVPLSGNVCVGLISGADTESETQ